MADLQGSRGQAGEDYNVEQEGDRAPFRRLGHWPSQNLGAKIFATMKGVADGGIDVPQRDPFMATILNRRGTMLSHRDRISGSTS